MKLVVAGVGYVGIVTGTCLADFGYKVTCIDTDEVKIEDLKRGITSIYEPGLKEILQRNCKNGRLDFTTNYKDAYKDADVIFIGVGTPEKVDGSANLDYVFQVCKQIAENANKDCLVVVKSTVPVGTNDRVEVFLNVNKANNINIEVASNPEFLSQGTAVIDTLKGNRIIIGVESKNAENILKGIYKPFNQQIVVTDRKSAEMIKYASNDFLALKISFINEIANLCEIVGANIEDVVKGMSYDKRIGDKFLNSGLGYGGSCFPKDTKALHWLANDRGYELKTIKATIEVNEKQKYKLLSKAKRRFKNLKGMKIAALGLTFKPETDDLREAPSIPNIEKFLDEGASVTVYDPVGIYNFKKLFKEKIEYRSTPEETLRNADMVFIFTEWEEIKNLSLDKYIELMNTPIIFDGRNCYDIEEAKIKNIEYYSIGREEIINLKR